MLSFCTMHSVFSGLQHPTSAEFQFSLNCKGFMFKCWIYTFKSIDSLHDNSVMQNSVPHQQLEGERTRQLQRFIWSVRWQHVQGTYRLFFFCAFFVCFVLFWLYLFCNVVLWRLFFYHKIVLGRHTVKWLKRCKSLEFWKITVCSLQLPSVWADMTQTSLGTSFCSSPKLQALVAYFKRFHVGSSINSNQNYWW